MNKLLFWIIFNKLITCVFCVPVYDDLLLAVNQGNEAVLIVLDYSAASDTISHKAFLDRLCHRYGVSGFA